jgi:hypothetical protein
MSLNVSWIAQYAAPKWPDEPDLSTSGPLRAYLLDAAIRTRDRLRCVEVRELAPTFEPLAPQRNAVPKLLCLASNDGAAEIDVLSRLPPIWG